MISRLYRWASYSVLGFLLLVMVLSYFLKKPLFEAPYSRFVLDADNQLLAASIAADGQWRFHSTDSLPERYKQSLLLFEDRYFFKHPGFNPVSLLKALRINLLSGAIKRGGSTLSMQLIRLAYQNTSRTYTQKVREIVLAFALEMQFTKQQILNMYAAAAPLGGNIVGLEAASWRYFGHEMQDMSWAEAALLAVLPNAPSLIHPGRNPDALFHKRNQLLEKLLQYELLDTLTYEMSILEPLPGKPLPLPNKGYHLLQYQNTHNKPLSKTFINREIQNKVLEVLANHYDKYLQEGIHNAAVVVIEPASNHVLAYAGNFQLFGQEDGLQIDMVRQKRSSGSILKPFLYAALNQEGMLLPNSLVSDVPSFYQDFHPENFDKSYLGVVPASTALARSLNVPAVHMLVEYGQGRFLELLPALGIHSMTMGVAHYGLTMILGGGEVSLWEVATAYNGLSRLLLHYDENYGLYRGDEFSPPKLWREEENQHSKQSAFALDAAAAWITLKALRQVNRPETEKGWYSFADRQQIAWKTGTSYGLRDAWAVGCSPDYTVAVWVGNANNTGRPDLTGIKKAGPILFEIFRSLKTKNQFVRPDNEMSLLEVCSRSGNLAAECCPETHEAWVHRSGLRSKACSYHRLVHLDQSRKWQVNRDCYESTRIVDTGWFVLPPREAYYYQQAHIDYRFLPDWAESCRVPSRQSMVEVFPVDGAKVYLPRMYNAEQNPLVMEIAHMDADTKVYWHLDHEYLGATVSLHKMKLNAKGGKHQLFLTDEYGDQLVVNFELLNPD